MRSSLLFTRENLEIQVNIKIAYQNFLESSRSKEDVTHYMVHTNNLQTHVVKVNMSINIRPF